MHCRNLHFTLFYLVETNIRIFYPARSRVGTYIPTPIDRNKECILHGHEVRNRHVSTCNGWT